MTLQKTGKLVFPIAVFEAQEGPVEVEWAPHLPEEWGENPFPEAVTVTIGSQKMDTGYLIEIETQGRATLICDRCGTDFVYAVDGKVRSFFAFATGVDRGEDVEVHVIPSSARQIDLTQDALDALILELPVKRLCSDACQGLCPQCGANLNEGACGCRPEETDPRWEALKGLSFDDKP